MASKLQSVKMLSLLMLVGFILPLVLSLVGCAKAPEAVITEVAELNSRHMPLAYMNSGGKIVWISETANGNALYLYSDGDVRKITSDDSKYHSWPQINDSGQIIWVVLNEEGRGYDLHVYKDGVTTEIVGTDDTYLVPRQNSSGTVVWHQLIKEETGGRFGIFSFNDGTTTQITNSYQHGYVFPQISDSGQIIWFGTDDNGDLHIYSYENGTIAQISDVSLKHLSVSELAEEGVQFDGNINSTGHMVWAGKEEHADSPTQIYLNENGTTTRFTNSQSSCNHPEIADNNHVVWQETEVDSYGNVDTEVVYYHDGVISRITDNDTRDESPSINSRGDIIWQHHDGNDYEIFLRDGKNGKIVQVTDNSIDDVHPKISSEGKLLWVTREYQAGWIYRGIYTASARAFLDTKVNIEGASTQLRNAHGNASLASFQGSSMPWKAHASATGTENLEVLPSTLAASDSDPLYT
ncbi:MAG: hypothetical protein HQ578_00960, partial [Chloroflexi bacterium]|nr:hypothetical protein [Chloroflexota bacterium]